MQIARIRIMALSRWDAGDDDGDDGGDGEIAEFTSRLFRDFKRRASPVSRSLEVERRINISGLLVAR